MSHDPRIQYGDLPLTWLWDLHPLADGAWGNVRGFDDNSGDGYTIDMRLWLRPGQMSNYPPPAYRPAHAGLPPYAYADGGTRRCYVPQPEDLARVRDIFPSLPDPSNPSWPQVETNLIAADRSPDELRRMTAPALIGLLAKLHSTVHKEPQSNTAVSDDASGEDEQQTPALTKGERITLAALATFDASRLASAADVSGAMPGSERHSDRTTREAIRKLVELQLVERPEGEKQGARLTLKGRRLAAKLAD